MREPMSCARLDASRGECALPHDRQRRHALHGRQANAGRQRGPRRAVLVLTRLSAVTLVAVASACAACAATPVTTPRSRVAKDLGCTTEGTQVEQIAEIPGQKAARWQVTGCGR